MKLASSLYYLIDRRIGKPSRFERLYALDPDPFGCEVLSYEKEKAKVVLESLQGKHFAHILDIGCGGGTLTRALAPFADRITAIDFSERAITIAKNYPSFDHIHYFCKDIRRLELDQYDLIVCSEVLYYLNENDLENFIDLLCRTQPTGTQIITVGKIHDSSVSKILGKRLIKTYHIQKDKNRRPYAVGIYQTL